MRRSGRWTLGGAVLVAVLVGWVGLSLGGALAASPCSGRPTTSPDGTVVHGSPCADRIVVTSPAVRKVVGDAGDDVIYVNAEVAEVVGGEGDDTIFGELPGALESDVPTRGPTYFPASRKGSAGAFATASIEVKNCEANAWCFGGDGNQELVGSSGNDQIFGQRGNDVLKGNGGTDELFGGVGDESLIAGGSGDDLLAGGLGTDHLNGEAGSDVARGDGTIDDIEDNGAGGTDTLSFETGVTPGFHGTVGIANFPADSNSEERGVNIRLDGTTCDGSFQACDNEARYGGGDDEIAVSGFENVIGSPFADYISGSAGANRIDGGGGADVIYGNGGADQLYGGADGDYISGGAEGDVAFGGAGSNNCATDVETANECSGSAESVTQRDRSKISVGFMVASPPESLHWIGLYMSGSNSADKVKVVYSTGAITFTTEAESASFDTNAAAKTPGCFNYEATKVECGVSKTLDAIVLAGMSGNDAITTEGFAPLASPILLGGEGNDVLTARNGTEDMLVDGPGAFEDSLSATGYDDALINNEGKDTLQGGNGNDLLLSASNCDGDTLQGAEAGSGDGTAVNSASWAKYPLGLPGIVADLEKGKAGNGWSSGPVCSSGTLATLANIDDLEGSSGNDVFFGDGNSNNLLGRLGEDQLWGRAGADNIEAKGEPAEADTGGGGAESDTCRLDNLDSFTSCNP